ncbi:LacI family DNA-binding transcriptional regulator [Lentzea flaviverrucosa]|uniref:LacI family transcriptional regulator n=1 Tax=Lentzea flaviverrucosa TaxID=200379 RepID=A0A1H9XW72_9PSEU|nr:substrate-binding domain-containing protein [Lentzea flaviverrucosa]RDI34438.1 LacI family transcriptional regulator [Lentzea flaviverrucosa]SES50391.1 LacI family transcriptional regulator [Lentzea flaviverrucosa]
MGSPVRIRDVAMRAKVSVGTVSNVLNRPEVVTPATRDRVLSAIRELGFIRNDAARQLRSGTPRAIGLIVLDVANPFFTDVARGVEEAASEAGHVVILCNSDGSSQREARHVELLGEQRVHGVLITPVDLDVVGRLRERGVSVVLVDHPTDDPDACSVAVDDLAGGELALTHLLAEGYERIVMVNGPSHIHQLRQRHRGALAAVRKAGRPAKVLEELKVPSLSVACGQRAGEQILARAVRPDAVFCANDMAALGVLQVFVRAGVRVPEDIAIVGYDDIDFASAAAVPLTSVRQPRQQIGRTAAEMVIAETLDADHEHRHVLFEPELVVRESSRRPRRKRSR